MQREQLTLSDSWVNARHFNGQWIIQLLPLQLVQLSQIWVDWINSSVTSAYMVAVMAGMPIFGKLSDMYGRKRFYIFGLLIFLIGSALCGTAQSIVQLSIYRAIQGIGGALMPIALPLYLIFFLLKKRENDWIIRPYLVLQVYYNLY